MNYLTENTLSFSFNGRKECFLKDDTMEYTIKISDCYKSDAQENLFYEINEDNMANIYYIKDSKLEKYKENVNIYKRKGFIFIEDENKDKYSNLEYLYYENEEVKSVSNLSKTYSELEDKIKQVYCTKNKHILFNQFIEACEDADLFFIFSNGSDTQERKINCEDMENLINNDYKIIDIIKKSEDKIFKLFRDKENKYNSVIKRVFASGTAENESSSERMHDVNRTLDCLIDDFGYKASSLSILREYCFDTIYNADCLIDDIVSEILEIEGTRNNENYFVFLETIGNESFRELDRSLTSGVLSKDFFQEFFYMYNIDSQELQIHSYECENK